MWSSIFRSGKELEMRRRHSMRGFMDLAASEKGLGHVRGAWWRHIGSSISMEVHRTWRGNCKD
jgi:hypothetical protein